MPVDREKLREQKRNEWRAKGYPDKLIEDALKWADKWCKGMARRFIREPILRAQVEEHLFPEALELSDKFIEAMAK